MLLISGCDCTQAETIEKGQRMYGNNVNLRRDIPEASTWTYGRIGFAATLFEEACHRLGSRFTVDEVVSDLKKDRSTSLEIDGEEMQADQTFVMTTRLQRRWEQRWHVVEAVSRLAVEAVRLLERVIAAVLHYACAIAESHDNCNLHMGSIVPAR